MAVIPERKSSHLGELDQAQRLVRYLRPTHQFSVSDLKRLKRERLSPPTALEQWLEAGTDWERDLLWRSIEKHISPFSLPNILLVHLRQSKYPDVSFVMAFKRTMF